MFDDEQTDDPYEDERFGHFLSEGLITGVLRTLKSGKEADVFLCRTEPRLTGGERLAAIKVQRPRHHRNFRNDARYLEGRFRKITSEVRAMEAKNRAGREISQAMWIEHEWQTMRTLSAAGVDVPRPIALSENAILMTYVGDERTPAPQLRQVRVGREDAGELLERLLWNIELMLINNVVHADLSSFNVLYWEGRGTVIDLPQAVDPRFNPNAYELLERDIRNLCGYFSRQGVNADAATIAADLWTRFMFAEL